VLGCLVVGARQGEGERVVGVRQNAGELEGVPVRTSQYRTGCRGVCVQSAKLVEELGFSSDISFTF